ncbi:polysaccharide deacetylase family protein [Sphaerisporangium corydalis]|uniref:Polysaccharide deacetylase family protein n=1 Tax=Sphaerisporangium corydalis TaxID=1441875 RepID=A0ABV9EV13_9ACTN|nr:polysaccharide deacetylase family protein [Sphaerisporangium corydalis]
MEESEVGRRRALWALGTLTLASLLVGDAVRPTLRVPVMAPVARPRRRVRPHAAVRRAAEDVWTPASLRARHQPVHSLRDLAPAAPGNAIALTIDDGPHPEWTPRMLDLLAEHEIRATFSLIGMQVERFPRLAERIVRAGHQLCNHTMRHPIPFNLLSARRITSEIVEAQRRIEDATGVAARFFRAPGGSWSGRVVRAADAHGMIPVDWDVDPRDWSRPGSRHIAESMLACGPGAILLCHDGGGDRSETLNALRMVIPRLKDRGLTFVSL